MPNLAAPAGATPSLLSLLTPVPAAPSAPVDGAAGPSFADIVAGLTSPPELPPVPLPTGQTLPVERPEIAGAAPDPAPEADDILGRCGWSPEPLDQPSPPMLEVPGTIKPIRPLEPAPVADPGVPMPAREFIRLPLRAVVLTSAPKAILARVVQNDPAPAPDALVPDTGDRSESPRQLGPDLPLAVASPSPEPQPAPPSPPIAALPEQPLPVQSLPVAPTDGDAEPAAPVASLPMTVAGSAPTAPVLPSSNGVQPPAEAGGHTQQDAQPQPQPQPKPVLVPAMSGDLRIAPELARQVAQMIRPAAERASEPQTVSTAAVEAPLPVSAAPAPQPVAAPAPVPAPAQPATFQSAPVDLGRAGWVETMIERIAELPQVDRREAQIKLLPDMLGKVEVTLVQREERVHVTLNAETLQARQLLAEAAPRLQELAEARGLRLGQTEIGGGTPQDRRGPQDQNQPQTPLRPRSAAAEQTDETSTPNGDRVA